MSLAHTTHQNNPLILPRPPRGGTAPFNARRVAEHMDQHEHVNQHNPIPRGNGPVLPTNSLKMRANINIATLNMNGLLVPSSRLTPLEQWSKINQTLNQYKIAILTLQ